MMPAVYCRACSTFTKGMKWLDMNSLEPCVTNANGIDCNHAGPEEYFAIVNVVLPEAVDITAYEFVTVTRTPRPPVTLLLSSSGSAS